MPIKIAAFIIINIVVMFGMIIMLKQVEDIILSMNDDNLYQAMDNYFSVISLFIGFSASILSRSIMTKVKITKSSNTLREQINNQKSGNTIFTISLNYTLIQGAINSAILIFLK